MKLFHMLEHLEESGFAHVISFQPHGRALRIHNAMRFQTDILPRYFPDNKHLGSFLRQLNIYGFRRMINNGPDRDSYYHAMFLRGRPDLCNLIERPLKSEHSKRQKYDPLTEPIFSTMPSIQVLTGDSVQVSELKESKSGRQALQGMGCSNHLADLPLFISPTLVLPQNIQNNFHAASLANSNGSMLDCLPNKRCKHQTQASNNSMMPSGVKSETDVPALSFSNMLETPIASFIYSRTKALPVNNIDQKATSINHHIRHTINSIPASVVAAAASLLENQHLPHISNDPCCLAVDQYCVNLAINIVSQYCLQLTDPPNTRQEEEQGQLRCNGQHQQPVETNTDISPLPLSESSLRDDRNTFQFDYDIGSQGDCLDTSFSGSSDMTQFLEYANLTVGDPN